MAYSMYMDTLQCFKPIVMFQGWIELMCSLEEAVSFLKRWGDTVPWYSFIAEFIHSYTW